MRALERGGYVVTHIRGSHHYLRRRVPDDGNRGALVTVPVHGNRDLPPGTLKSILQQAGLTVDELVELLKD